MRAFASFVIIAASACSACSGPAATPDASVDAPMFDADTTTCPGAEFLTGAYVDWDSTDANFHGVAFASWVLGSQTDMTAPNGRVQLCIPTTGRSLVTVTSKSGDAHLNGHFIADAAVFADGRVFDARGITATRAAQFFTDNAIGTYDPGKGLLLVHESGTPVALTLSGATAQAMLSSPDGVTWTAGSSTGKFVLFTNISVTGTPHLAGPATGAGDIPIVNGEITMTSVIGS